MAFFEGSVQFGEPAQIRPYLPSYAAGEHLLGDVQNVNQPGVHVSNGLLVGATNGGIIRVGDQEWGIDLVSLAGSGNHFELTPSEKSSVIVDKPHEGIGRIVSEGAVALSNMSEGLLVLCGVITGDYWEAENSRAQGHRVHAIDGRRWVIQSDLPMRAEMLNIERSGEAKVRLLSS